MKQLTIEGFSYCKPADSWDKDADHVVDGFSYHFARFSMSEVKGYIHVGTASVTIIIPDDFDPRQGAVDALREQRQKLLAEFQEHLNKIDAQISRFTALEYVEAQ